MSLDMFFMILVVLCSLSKAFHHTSRSSQPIHRISSAVRVKNQRIPYKCFSCRQLHSLVLRSSAKDIVTTRVKGIANHPKRDISMSSSSASGLSREGLLEHDINRYSSILYQQVIYEDESVASMANKRRVLDFYIPLYTYLSRKLQQHQSSGSSRPLLIGLSAPQVSRPAVIQP
jgi:hypothetical protein